MTNEEAVVQVRNSLELALMKMEEMSEAVIRLANLLTGPRIAVLPAGYVEELEKKAFGQEKKRGELGTSEAEKKDGV